MLSELRIGSLIKDSGKIGVVTNIVEQGKWVDDGPFNLTKNYEITYSDGQITIMNEFSMSRLMGSGVIVVLVY